MKPNVIIVTFDCLRPDHLGFAGYKGVETPTFDRLAEESLVFENAYCQGPNTWISHASMFTGCLPAVHGVRTPLRKIRAEVPTMAEVLKGQGYATFALPGTTLLSPAAGFDRGFDRYDLSDLQGRGGGLDSCYYRGAENALAKIDTLLHSAKPPFFLWIHYFGIHTLGSELLDLPPRYSRAYSEYAEHYDGKVSYADQAFLASLVELLTSRGLLDRTLLVLWSDHGEDLAKVGPAGWSSGHNVGLEEEVVRILLMMRIPGGGVRGRRGEVVSSTDIAPTVYEICGLSHNGNVQGVSRVEAGTEAADGAAYFENLCQGFLGLRAGPWKLVLGSTAELRGEVERAGAGRLRLAEKLAWRWAVLRDAFATVLRRTSKPRLVRAHGHRVPAEWWRKRKEPEEVAAEALKTGAARLWQWQQGGPCLIEHAEEQCGETVALLRSKLAKLSLPGDVDASANISEEEQERLRDDLSALGYM